MSATETKIIFAVQGEWEDEPDNESFVHAELPCYITRHPGIGHLCGYVGVPPAHSAYEKAYDDIEIEAHGGLTYAARGDANAPGEAQGGFWWLGSDCAHAGDYTPPTDTRVQQIHLEVTGRSGPGDHEVYRNWAYVRGETERLAEQLAVMMPQPTLEEWNKRHVS